MKKSVSLFNSDLTEKKHIKNISSNFFLKPAYFTKFSNETLFYIFYYMPRDTLQLLASEELYKRKWRFNTDHAIWFTQETNEENKTDKPGESYLYFNPNEWKIMKYVYGPLNQKAFLTENEIFKYTKQDK
jgi:CCR4-NOT transcriptional regulation complex NOT5 subunit